MPSRALLPALFTCGLAVFFIAGCAAPGDASAPNSSAPIKRSAISIVAVRYPAADAGKIQSNQIPNTAPSRVFVEAPVALTLRKTLGEVLQRAGFQPSGPARSLSAGIAEVLADDLGFGVDWTLRIRYTVHDPAGRTLYEQTKVTRRSTTKFVNVTSTVEDLLQRNVTDLVADDTFRHAVR